MSKQPSKSSLIAPSRTFDVQINKIRVPPPEICQRHFSKPWGEKLAAELDLNKIGHPVVNLRDHIFWNIDGQHRIFALKARGFDQDKDTWPCEVFEDLTDSQMAEMFLERNNTKNVTPFTKFNVACTAERPRETAIRRLVEGHGLKVSRAKSEGCVGAVTALCKVYDRSGELVLGQVLRTIRDSFAAQAESFDGILMEGLGLMYARYNGRTEEKTLVQQLCHIQYGAAGVLRRAESQHIRTGNQKTQCVAAVLVDVYNKGALHKKRLPTWWKTADADAGHMPREGV